MRHFLKRTQAPIKNIELIRKAKNLRREYIAKELSLNLSSYGKMERGETGLSLERLYELATIFGMEAEDILTYNKTKKGNVSYVPIEIQADFLSKRSKKHIDTFKTYHLPFIDGENLYMINATEDSMFPTISPGDHIVIEQVEDMKTIKYGRTYILVAKDGCVIKRIHSHTSSKKFLLKSDNVTYEPYEIDKQDIISIWLVRNYLLRTTLTSRGVYMYTENDSSNPKQNKKPSK